MTDTHGRMTEGSVLRVQRPLPYLRQGRTKILRLENERSWIRAFMEQVLTFAGARSFYW